MKKEIFTSKKILFFWAPLAATWLMMSVEGPFLAALIARLDFPKFNLAAFGVAFSFALIVEAPIIMIMSASTALVESRDDYFKLRNYTFILNGIITGIMLIGLYPPIFYDIAEKMIGLPHEVAKLTYYSTMILLPWPAAIGFRRFYHGLLIRNGLTKRVAYGTAVRLISMSTTAVFLYLGKMKGAYVGAFSLSAGVVSESVFSRFAVNRTLKDVLKREHGNEKKLTFSGITSFYYPLALTSMLSLGVNPIVVFFLGRSSFPIESLAVLPVVNSFIFIFRSLGLSMQEVIIAILSKGDKNIILLKNFIKNTGFAIFSILLIIVFTPLVHVWFRSVAGLSSNLADFSIIPVKIMSVLPLLTLLISFQRSILVYVKKTSPVKWASAIEILLIVIVLLFSNLLFSFPGAIGAALAYVIGRIGANIYLYPHQKNAENMIVSNR